MIPFNETIELWEQATGACITLFDCGGIPHGYGLHRNHYVKNKTLCATVKADSQCYKRCLRCKKYTNRRGSRAAFSAFCPYGVQEVVVPLYCRDTLAGILYIGNFTTDAPHSRDRLISAGFSAELADTLVQNHPLNLWEKLGSHLAGEFTAFAEALPPSATPIPHAVQTAIRIVEQAFGSPLTLESVATECAVHPQYLGRLFTKHTGERFHQMLNRIRIERAKHLLHKTDYTVLEIAMLCGYENVTYFNRLFKRDCGMTPREYRKMQC
ncbi:MAG: helix-turn-helix domain-containing protein [Clostridia bacterium]|nr:helix-turn-helix domain-containing protein [Clostridia bacterium]